MAKKDVQEPVPSAEDKLAEALAKQAEMQSIMEAQAKALADAEERALKAAVERDSVKTDLAEMVGDVVDTPSAKDVQEFWLTQPRYLKQVGEAYPSYIEASPKMPVKVRLPKYVMRVKDGVLTKSPRNGDRFLQKVVPKVPKDPRPQVSQGGAPVKTGATPVTPVLSDGVREADR